MSTISFRVNNQPVTGVQAEAHYVEWCLALSNEGHTGVPRTSLDAVTDFQQGAFRGHPFAQARLMDAGISKHLA